MRKSLISAQIGDNVLDMMTNKIGTVARLGQTGNYNLIYVNFGRGERKINPMHDAMTYGRYRYLTKEEATEFNFNLAQAVVALKECESIDDVIKIFKEFDFKNINYLYLALKKNYYPKLNVNSTASIIEYVAAALYESSVSSCFYRYTTEIKSYKTTYMYDFCVLSILRGGFMIIDPNNMRTMKKCKTITEVYDTIIKIVKADWGFTKVDKVLFYKYDTPPTNINEDDYSSWCRENAKIERYL